MSNVNEAWLDEWLDDVKAVKTWTALEDMLDKKDMRINATFAKPWTASEDMLDRRRRSFETFFKDLAAGADDLNDANGAYGDGKPIPALLLVISNHANKSRNYPRKVVGILKVTGFKKVNGFSTKRPVLDSNIFYIEGEHAADYADEKIWGSKLKERRDKFLYEDDKDKLKEFINHNLKAYLSQDYCHFINEKGRVERKESHHLPGSKQIIFYGPPGTGKTRRAKIEAVRIVKNDPDFPEEEALNSFVANASTDAPEDTVSRQIRKQIRIVQFHPGYSYNDFMETVDMTRKGYADRIFMEFAEQARLDREKPYVLIIDEINRANVSEVLGELLYGIEYREVDITTETSGKSFSVPENLYIIGTMNTADHSLQNLDYAVRRRFDFEKLKSEEPETIHEGEAFLKDAFKMVQEDVKTSVARGIDPEDIMPGISYFMINTDGNGDYDQEHFDYKMKCELIPLLKEYVKDGMFTKRKKIHNNLSLTELLQKEQYFGRIKNSLEVKRDE